VVFHFSERMISVLPPMIRLFDFCTKWVNLRGGDDLVQQGEQSQGKLYIVLFGTLLCLVNKDSTPSSENSAGLERGAEMEVEEGEGTSSEEDVNGDRGGEGSSVTVAVMHGAMTRPVVGTPRLATRHPKGTRLVEEL